MDRANAARLSTAARISGRRFISFILFKFFDYFDATPNGATANKDRQLLPFCSIG
jgi:hypothetical protein